MDARTRNQESRYTMALGYAWGRKDGAAYGTESGKRAMTTSALDFATWYATSEDDGIDLEQCWDAFSKLPPSRQREVAKDAEHLPYIERPGPND